MKTFEFTQEIYNGGFFIWGVTAEPKFIKERFGEDADGRRGITQIVIDEIEFTDWTLDQEVVKEDSVPPEVREALELMAWECDDWDGQSEEDARADEGDRKFHELRDEGKI